MKTIEELNKEFKLKRRPIKHKKGKIFGRGKKENLIEDWE
jgi:hypothetical protein